MHLSSQTSCIDSKDSLCKSGNTKTWCFIPECRFKLPFKIAWIICYLVIWPQSWFNSCLLWRYFSCSNIRDIFNVPESTFIIFQLLEIAIPANGLCLTYVFKYNLSSNWQFCVAPIKSRDSFHYCHIYGFRKVHYPYILPFYKRTISSNVGNNHKTSSIFAMDDLF